MPTEYSKPLPRAISPELTKPFWDGAKRGELLMPRCKRCDNMFFYPREECPKCASDNLAWVKVSGKGRLHSFTIVRQPADPSFHDAERWHRFGHRYNFLSILLTGVAPPS